MNGLKTEYTTTKGNTYQQVKPEGRPVQSLLVTFQKRPVEGGEGGILGKTQL